MPNNRANNKKRSFRMVYHDEIPVHLFAENPQAVSMYLYLKLRAWDKKHNKTYKGKKVELQPFEIPFSLRDLSNALNMTHYKTTKLLSILETEMMIRRNIKNGFTIIRILETRQTKLQTPSNPLLKRVSEEKTPTAQTPLTETHTGVISTKPGDPDINDSNTQTQYKKNVVNRGKNNNELKEKKIDDSYLYEKVNHIINYINQKYKLIGNLNMELEESNERIRKKIKSHIQQAQSTDALKMEIGRYFQNISYNNRLSIHFGELDNHLTNILSKKPLVEAD